MVDSINLEKRFGADVIALNLSPEEKYLMDNKHILNDNAMSAVDHIISTPFSDSKDVLVFLSDILNVDIDLCNEHLPKFINEVLKCFQEYCGMNPYFDKSKPESWCDGLDGVFNICKQLIYDYNLECGSNVNLSENNVPDDKLKENIYKDLDDNSILLLYGLLTGNYNTGYTSGMRDTIYNDIKRNGEKSSVGRVVLHSLKENESMNFSNLLENYDMDLCKNVQNNGTVLFSDDDCIKSIIKLGDNKYCIEVLSESKSSKK